MKRIRFLIQSLTPISDFAVKKYLARFPDASLKWQAFMEGATALTTAEISQMTTPELSVLRYALAERHKNQNAMYESVLGGMV